MVETLPGFVFNVANSLNLDIDLDINEASFSKKIKKYNYDYEDKDGIKRGNAYSCRIRGIKSKNSRHDPDRKRKESNTLITVKALIEKYKGWVNVKIYNVDKHHRLIISLYDINGIDIGAIILEDIDNFALFNR